MRYPCTAARRPPQICSGSEAGSYLGLTDVCIAVELVFEDEFEGIPRGDYVAAVLALTPLQLSRNDTMRATHAALKILFDTEPDYCCLNIIRRSPHRVGGPLSRSELTF